MFKIGKKIFNFSLVGALLVFISLYIYSQIQLHTPATEYNFDVQTDDFYIRNLNFVVGYNDTFVFGYHLETMDLNKKFDGIAYVITVDGRHVSSSSQSDDPFTLPDAHDGIANRYDHSYVIHKTSLKATSKLKIEIYYTVDGHRKEMTGEVQLNKLKKLVTTSNNSKRYVLNVD